jgi:prophage antirepressor-like protein
MSKEPAARIFRRWVTASEVLITVNILSNFGCYMTPYSSVDKRIASMFSVKEGGRIWR